VQVYYQCQRNLLKASSLLARSFICSVVTIVFILGCKDRGFIVNGKYVWAFVINLNFVPAIKGDYDGRNAIKYGICILIKMSEF